MTHTSISWKSVSFDRIVELITDRIDKPDDDSPPEYIGLEHIDSEKFTIKRFGVSKGLDSAKFICQPGDIIFGRRRAYLKKLAIADRKATVSTDAMIFRPKETITNRFLPFLLSSSLFWELVLSLSRGSMSPRVKWKDLAKKEFLLPPIEEQKKIAEILWAIEDNIEKIDNLITINEKLKKGSLRNLFTKGIGHTKFKKTEIGDIPEEWDFVEFDKAVKTIPNSFFTKLFQKNYLDQGNIPIVDQGQKSICGYINEEEKKYKGELPVIMFGDHTRILKYIDFDFAVGADGTKLLMPINPTILKTKYLFYYLKSLIIPEAGYQRHFKYLKLNNIIIPSIKEQTFLISKIEKIEEFIQILIFNSKSLKNLKKKLLDDILKGEVKV